ncbi:4Fe-4S binding protein [Candidatus Solincola tengchongensis]|uniref:4Fe-4S binding protein n=1 Tax=Candidatus Solincola tengchongensis TaxID=2900693 RepID=UPI002579F6C3|nr:4Fe-4S binding protein [Candidatus Solincola tengchongensis]
MRDSVKRFFKMFGNRNLEGFIHGYLYGRFPNAYVYRLGKLINVAEKEPPHDLPPEMEDILDVVVGKVARETLDPATSTYHAKVVRTEHAVDLVNVKENVYLPRQERVIPYPIANDIILEDPDHIGVIECPCRHTQSKPCLPLDVCLVVGEPFLGFLEEHKPNNFRRLLPEEATRILKEEHERGHVHCAYFKDAAGGRFFAICNCCSCCCIGMKAYLAFGSPNICSSGYVARVDAEECSGCGSCVEACPFKALSLGDDLVAEVDPARCFGCGVCASRCELEAITLERDPEKPAPMDIKALLAEAGGEAGA